MSLDNVLFRAKRDAASVETPTAQMAVATAPPIDTTTSTPIEKPPISDNVNESSTKPVVVPQSSIPSSAPSTHVESATQANSKLIKTDASDDADKSIDQPKISHFQYYNSTIVHDENTSNKYWSQEKEFHTNGSLSTSNTQAIVS